jgi:hypothetical protein
MSDEFVNQLTLNFLISKNQLHKLNKKMQEDTEKTRMIEMKKWEDRVKMLFQSLLDNDPPSDILLDVKNAFDTFVDKSIYYLKNHDRTIELENERTEDIKDDIDYEKEERDIEKGNYIEKHNDYEKDEDENEYNDNDIDDYDDGNKDGDDEDNHEEQEQKQPITVDTNIYTSFSGKRINTKGVDNIEKVQLNWFEEVRKGNQKNKIMPRKKA